MEIWEDDAVRKNHLLFYLTIFLALFVHDFSWANKAVQFEAIVRQKPAAMDKYFEVHRDTLVVLEKGQLFAFMVNFGLDIVHERTDSNFVEFSIHLTTIGKSPYTISEKFRIEFDLPGRIENIPGKQGAVYQLLISPRSTVDIDENDCPYDIGNKNDFTSQPSTNFDIYYVQGSLADFRWNGIKSYLEGDYDLFHNALKLNLPGKLNFYLCPCTIPSIHWDRRFGFAVDPGRSRAFAIYNHGYSSAEAVLTNITRLLREWGYAPPFLVEGMAGYFEFVNYEAKKAAQEDGLLHIADLLTGKKYYQADPLAAELTAASFVKYLSDEYGLAKFQQFYEESDDLTISLMFPAIYGKTLDSLEMGWRNYVDTVSLNRSQFQYYAARASLMNQPDRRTEYFEVMQSYDKTKADSIGTLTDLSMIYYQSGRYYDALKGYRQLIAIDAARPLYYQIIGNLFMINGEYDKANIAFDSVMILDTTYVSARLRQAQIMAIRGDTAQAIKTAENFYSYETTTPAKIEFLLFLGSMYGTPGTNYDSLEAHRSYSDALSWTMEVLGRVPQDPSYQLRAGLANFGLKDYDGAAEHLEFAYFTETRTFNLGNILLALGMLHDAQNQRDKAIEYYQACLANQSSVRDQELCRRYLNEPFRD